jgi:hypothetical protein
MPETAALRHFSCELLLYGNATTLCEHRIAFSNFAKL